MVIVEPLKEFYGRGKYGDLERGVYRVMDVVKGIDTKTIVPNSLEVAVGKQEPLKVYEQNAYKGAGGWWA